MGLLLKVGLMEIMITQNAVLRAHALITRSIEPEAAVHQDRAHGEIIKQALPVLFAGDGGLDAHSVAFGVRLGLALMETQEATCRNRVPAPFLGQLTILPKKCRIVSLLSLRRFPGLSVTGWLLVVCLLLGWLFYNCLNSVAGEEKLGNHHDIDSRGLSDISNSQRNTSIRAPLAVGYVPIRADGEKSTYRNPQCHPFKFVSFLLLGVIFVCFCARNLYLYGDPFKLCGWFYFGCLLVGVCIFIYGLDAGFDCIGDGISQCPDRELLVPPPLTASCSKGRRI